MKNMYIFFLSKIETDFNIFYIKLKKHIFMDISELLIIKKK